MSIREANKDSQNYYYQQRNVANRTRRGGTHELDLVQEIDLHDPGSCLVRTEIHKVYQVFFTKCDSLF